MTVALIHSRLALYWPARIRVLTERLRALGEELAIVEVGGDDSAYPFAPTPGKEGDVSRWRRLFHSGELRDLRSDYVSRSLWSALEEVNPLSVISSAIAFPTGATAVRWARHRRRHVIVMDNARLEDVPRCWLVNRVKRHVYRNVDAVLIPAPSHAESYLRWGVPPERIFFGLNVVDNAWFARNSASAGHKAESSRRHEELAERFFLGVGRQVAKKNWSALILAYHDYRRRSDGAAWGLVLVGDGPEHTSLRSLVTRLRIQGVRFLPSCRPEKTCRYYGLASALVLPSFYGETWGLVVNEAMACGLPVLVSRQCGCAESLVREGENGWTFSPQDRDELAEALLRMASLDQRKREAMGARSREIIAEWPLERFAEGALAAIEACSGVSRGFCSLTDKLLLSLWKGRYRPT